MLIRIIGRIGSGKSTIAKYIKENYNFKYIDVDKIMKELYKEKSVIKIMKRAFPHCVKDDVIDLKALRVVIFDDEKTNHKLLKITLPLLNKTISKTLKKDPDNNYIVESFMAEV